MTTGELLVFMAVGVAVAAPGVLAWLGIWRRWSHPRSGWGVIPLILLYMGISILVSSVAMLFIVPFDAPGEEPPLYVLPLALVGGAAILITVGCVWYLLIGRGTKRPPQWAIPRWLPRDWEVPLRQSKVVIVMAFRHGKNPLPVPSTDLGDQEARGAAPIARAKAYLRDPDNPDPFIEFIPMTRMGRLSLFPDVLVFAQENGEDIVREEPFVLVMRKKDLKGLAVRPPGRQGFLGLRLLMECKCLRRPGLVVEVPEGRYEFIVGERGRSQEFIDEVVETLKPSTIAP